MWGSLFRRCIEASQKDCIETSLGGVITVKPFCDVNCFDAFKFNLALGFCDVTVTGAA